MVEGGWVGSGMKVGAEPPKGNHFSGIILPMCDATHSLMGIEINLFHVIFYPIEVINMLMQTFQCPCCCDNYNI